MRILAVWLALAAGCAAIAQGPGDDVKRDLERLEGTWMVVQAEMNGAKSPEEEAKKHKIVINIKDKKLTIQAPKGAKTAAFDLDPTKRPKTIDLVPEDGQDKGKTLPGIYSLEGDQLKLCFQEKGKARPTEFATTRDSGLVLFVVRRAK